MNTEALLLETICDYMRSLAADMFETNETCSPDHALRIAVYHGFEKYVPFLLSHGAKEETYREAREQKAAFDEIRNTMARSITQEEFFQTLNFKLNIFGQMGTTSQKLSLVHDLYNYVISNKRYVQDHNLLSILLIKLDEFSQHEACSRQDLILFENYKQQLMT